MYWPSARGELRTHLVEQATTLTLSSRAKLGINFTFCSLRRQHRAAGEILHVVLDDVPTNSSPMIDAVASRHRVKILAN
jgi:hypothetical protein